MLGRHPCAGILDRQPNQRFAGELRGLEANRRARWRVLDGVLEGVGDRLVEEDRIDLDRWPVQLDVELAPGQPGSQAVERPLDEIIELEDVALCSQRASLDPAQVEQVGDQGLRYSTSRSMASTLSAWSSGLRPLP